MPTATGSDSILTVTTDPTWAGVQLKANFTGASTKPIFVQFLRGTTTVRSGDPAQAPGGYAIAYDHEAPLGTTSTWTAIPIYPDGSTGAPSVAVSVAVEAMASSVDCWLKPTNAPGSAVSFPVHSDKVEVPTSGRFDSMLVQGRGLPAINWDRRTPGPINITARTTTKAAKDAITVALDTGPVLVQLNPIYGIDDFYAVAADSVQKYFTTMASAVRDTPISYQPCQRPPTIDAPLLIPGKSWDQLAAQYATWNAVASGNATWNAVVGF